MEPVYQEALELFKAGKIDEAIAKLVSADPFKLIEQMIGQEKQDADDQAKLDARKQATAKSKESIIAQLRLLADMYGLKFNPAKAEALFDGLLQLDSTDLSILQDAANFYRENHRYEKALHVLPLIIAHPQAEDWEKANAHAHIGDMHTATGLLEPALQAYLAFNKAYADLLQADPNRSFYKNGLAVSYSQLGWFFQSKKNDKEKARNYYLQCQALGQEIAKDYPSFVDFKDRLKWVQNALKALDK